MGSSPLWLLFIGNPIMAKGTFAESMGVSRQFLVELQNHHHAPKDIVLPGKPTEHSPTGRGRQMVWTPAWFEYFQKLADDQGACFPTKHIFYPFSPSPDLLGQWLTNLEHHGLKVPFSFDDGGLGDTEDTGH